MGAYNRTSRDVIYLDYCATTPMDPLVLDAMMPYFMTKFGNASSRNHLYGWDASKAQEIAREEVAQLIGAQPKDIIFTSGATESNNIAIRGAALYAKKNHAKNHIITLPTEHKCVLNCMRSLAEEGFEITYLPIDAEGLISVSDLIDAITERTCLVSVMAVNNEIGVIQDLKSIGEICRARGVLLHTDAAQGFGKIPLNVEEMNIDLMSISGHKIYGPKGVGALYVRRLPKVRLTPVIFGGGQERGLRSGTVPIPLVVGLGRAARIATRRLSEDLKLVSILHAHFYGKIMQALDHVSLNGSSRSRYKGIINLNFAGIEGEGLLVEINDIAVSSGSACTSASLEKSYVLRALNVPAELAHSSLRVSFGRFSTMQEIGYAADQIIRAVLKLRSISPLWDMIQEGVDLSAVQWSEH